MPLITRDDLIIELSSSVSADDNLLLDNLVGGVWGLWESLTGRTWERAEHTEYHNIVSSDQNRLYLRQTPVVSVVSIHNDPDWVYGDGSLLDPASYAVSPASGIVYFNGWFIPGDRAVKVVYTAGYETAAFPAGIKQVLIRQAAHWFKQAKNFQDFEKMETLLPEVRLIVEQYRRRHVSD